MKCPICGGRARELMTHEMPEELMAQRLRACIEGHTFETREVHLTQLANKREMDCAIRNIKRRVAMFQRNAKIAADPRPAKEVAEDYGITQNRVRQIRAKRNEG